MLSRNNVLKKACVWLLTTTMLVTNSNIPTLSVYAEELDENIVTEEITQAESQSDSVESQTLLETNTEVVTEVSTEENISEDTTVENIESTEELTELNTVTTEAEITDNSTLDDNSINSMETELAEDAGLLVFVKVSEGGSTKLTFSDGDIYTIEKKEGIIYENDKNISDELKLINNEYYVELESETNETVRVEVNSNEGSKLNYIKFYDENYSETGESIKDLVDDVTTYSKSITLTNNKYIEVNYTDIESEEYETDKEPEVVTVEVDASTLVYRLIVGCNNEDVMTNGYVISEYEGVYIIGYETSEEREEGYSYYSSVASFVEYDDDIYSVAEEDYVEDGETTESTEKSTEEDAEDEEVIIEEVVVNSDDALTNLQELDNVSATIAVIDTGSNVSGVKAVSVIGDSVSDDNGHGTKMIQTILEENPNANIVSIKAFGSNGKASPSDVYAAIQYAKESGCSIINMSFAAYSTENNSIVREAIIDAINSGIIVVGAAGNYNRDVKYYIPGNINGAIIVGACDENGIKIDISNFGSTVDYYVVSNSTSEASAIMTGILSKDRELNNLERYSNVFNEVDLVLNNENTDIEYNWNDVEWETNDTDEFNVQYTAPSGDVFPSQITLTNAHITGLGSFDGYNTVWHEGHRRGSYFKVESYSVTGYDPDVFSASGFNCVCTTPKAATPGFPFDNSYSGSVTLYACTDSTCHTNNSDGQTTSVTYYAWGQTPGSGGTALTGVQSVGFEVTLTAKDQPFVYISVQKGSTDGYYYDADGVKYGLYLEESLSNQFLEFELDYLGRPKNVVANQQSVTDGTRTYKYLGTYSRNGVIYAKIGITGGDSIPSGTFYAMEENGNNNYYDEQSELGIEHHITIDNISTYEFYIIHDLDHPKEPFGSLQVYKVDDNNEPIGGATIELCQISATGEKEAWSWEWVSWEDAEVNHSAYIQTKVTGSTVHNLGIATFTKLTPGVYKVREKEAPEGYKKDPNTYTVTINTDNTVGGDPTSSRAMSYCFDYPYYKQARGDRQAIINAFGDGLGGFATHFDLYGANETVQGNATFNPSAYIANHSLSGYNGRSAVSHYQQYGADSSWSTLSRSQYNSIPSGTMLGNSTAAVILKIENTPLKVKVKKTSTTNDSLNNSNYSLQGATFDVYKSTTFTAANKVGTLTTGSNGETDWLPVGKGTYYIVETKSPKGYKNWSANDSVGYKAVTVSTEDKTVTFSDVALTDLDSVKVVKETVGGKPIKGAEFTFKYYESGVASGVATSTATFKTKTTGWVDFIHDTQETGNKPPTINGDYPLGLYTFEETSTPEPFIRDTTIYSFKIKEVTKTKTVNGVTVTDRDRELEWITKPTSDYLVFNTPKFPNTEQTGNISVQKYDKKTGQPTPLYGMDFKGIEYTIYYGEDFTDVEDVSHTAGEVVATIYCNKAGYIEYDGLHSAKYNDNGEWITGVSYYVKETGDGNEYYVNDDSNTYNFTIYGGEGVSGTGKNRVAVNAYKANSDSGDTGVYGTVEIYKYDKDRKTSAPRVGTNYNGIEYTIYLAELNRNNEGILYNNNRITAVGQEITKITIPNNGLKAELAENLPNDLKLPVGKYYIKETKGNSYYLNDDDNEYPFEVKKIGTGSTQTGSRTSIRQENGSNGGNSEQLGTVSIQKKDEETGETKPQLGYSFEGIEFTIYNGNAFDVEYGSKGNVIGPDEAIVTIVADENGFAEIPESSDWIHKLSVGKYYIIETKGNEWYNLGDEEGKQYPFEIKEDGDRKELTQEKGNPIKRGGIEFYKLQSLGDRKLSGIPFLITNNLNGESHIVVTNDSRGWYSTERTVKHETNTNYNDSLIALVETNGYDYIIPDRNIKESGGTYFGLDSNGNPINANNDKFALPIGTYTVRELRCEQNANMEELFIRDDVEVLEDEETFVVAHPRYNNIINTPKTPKITTVTSGKSGIRIPEYSTEAVEKDKVMLEDLAIHHKYILEGVIVNRVLQQDENGSTAVDLLDSDGNRIVATKEFTARTLNQTEEMEYIFNSTEMGGETGVIYLKLYDVTEAELQGLDEPLLVASDEVINNEDETFVVPYLDSIASDIKTKDNQGATNEGDFEYTETETDEDGNEVIKAVYMLPDGKIHADIQDIIGIHNALPDIEFTIKSKVKDLATGEFVDVTDGETSTILTDKEGNATVKIGFDAEIHDEGNNYIIYSYFYHNDVLLAVHEIDTDLNEQIHYLNITSEAKDIITETHYGYAGKEDKIEEVINIRNLQKGGKYEIISYPLFSDGSEVKINGEVLKQSKEIVATDDDLDTYSEVFNYTFDSTTLEGETIVFCAEVYYNGVLIASHKNLKNMQQTIKYPKIRTHIQDSNTEIQLAALGETEFIDTVDYWNTDIGAKTKAYGIIMDKDTGEYLGKDLGLEPIVAESEIFYPTEESGQIEVTFKIPDTSIYEGKTAVVYEDWIINDLTATTHHDINDGEQTIYIAKVRTNSYFENMGKHEIAEDKDIVYKDRVDYWNLQVGKTYKQSATLVDTNGNPFLINGEEVIAEVEFTPEKPNGYVILEFPINAKDLLGEEFVVFEDTYYNEIRVAAHHDLTDVNQWGSIPKIKTKAWDLSSGGKLVTLSEDAVVVDSIDFFKLLEGNEYTFKATLADANTKEVVATAEKDFTAKSKNGTVELEIPVDATKYVGRTLVVLEELYDKDNNKIAEEVEYDNEDQTVYVAKIGTQAWDTETQKKMLVFSENTKVTDEIGYENLLEGEEYIVKTYLMDFESKEEVLSTESKFITDETLVTDITITVNTKEFVGAKLVFFEEVYDLKGNKVAEHKDWEDENQTVYVAKIGTTAYVIEDEVNKKNFSPSEGTEIVDNIAYYQVEKGNYKIVTSAVIKSTGEVINTVTTEDVELNNTGMYDITIKIDTSNLAGEEIVIFEEIYDEDDNLIVEHKDLEDTNQTVKVNKPDVPKTSDSIAWLFIVGLTLLCGSFISYVIRKRKMNM